MNEFRDRSSVLMLRAALLAGSIGFAVTAAAAPECYKWSGLFSKERFVLDIEYHSRLLPTQHVFSVHGKHVGVCGYETIATVTGTIDATVDQYSEPVAVRSQPTIPSMSLGTVPDALKNVLDAAGAATRGLPSV